MNRLTLSLLAATLITAPFAAKADTVVNLNATTGNALTSYPTGAGNFNNLAPSFFSTVTLGPGSYSVSVVGAGYTASDGTKSVYSGWSYAAPPTGNFTEAVGLTSGGWFSNSSLLNGYQNSYTVGTTPAGLSSYLFNTGTTYATTAAALAASINTPYTFTLASTTSITFYIPDGSYLPTNNWAGFDDNTGGVSLDIKSTAVTPEPSSLLLLATGSLTAAGTIKRRIMNS